MGLGSAIGGVVSGILNKGHKVSAPDLTAIFKTIDDAGVYQKDLINKLPGNIQKLYEEYKTSNAGNLEALKTGTADLEDKYRREISDIYDPNAPAVKAANDAAKMAIYADLPGQQDAIRQALAATGGFDRGTAGKQLSAPILQAASKYAQSVAGTSAQQLQMKQQMQQKAAETIRAMDDATLQTVFGMNKEQALTIMNSSRNDLKDQLTDLVNQSVRQSQQKAQVQGADITNKYNAAVADKASKDALNNAWVNLGTNIIDQGGALIGDFMGSAGKLGGNAAGIQGGLGGTTQNTSQFGQTWSPSASQY